MIHTSRPAIFKPRPSFSTSISALVTKWSGDHFLKQNVPYFVRFVVLHYIEHLLLGRISKSRVTMDVKSGHIDSCLPRRFLVVLQNFTRCIYISSTILAHIIKFSERTNSHVNGYFHKRTGIMLCYITFYHLVCCEINWLIICWKLEELFWYEQVRKEN